MLAVPLYSLVIVYAVCLIIVAAFFLVNIGHLTRTGTFTLASFFVTLIFLGGTTLIIWTTWYLLQSVNWTEPLVIWNSDWVNNILGNIFPTNP